MGRIKELDIFKAIAAIMVIMIHVTATPAIVLEGSLSHSMMVVLNRFSRPCVAMFIFASGFALYYVYKDREFKYGTFIKKRFVRVLMPYLCWGIAYYAFFIWQDIYKVDVLFFIEHMLAGDMVYHFYFIIVILQYYLLFGIFYKIVKKYSAKTVIPIAAVINFASEILMPGIYYPKSFLAYILVFCIGCYFAKHYDAVRKNIIRGTNIAAAAIAYAVIGIACSILFVYDFSFEKGMLRDDNVSYIFFSVAGIALVYALCILVTDRMKDKKGVFGIFYKTLEKIGDASFYIYLAHPLFMFIGSGMTAYFGITGVLKEMMVSLILIFAVCVPLSMLYVKLKTSYKSRVRN